MSNVKKDSHRIETEKEVFAAPRAHVPTPNGVKWRTELEAQHWQDIIECRAPSDWSRPELKQAATLVWLYMRQDHLIGVLEERGYISCNKAGVEKPHPAATLLFECINKQLSILRALHLNEPKGKPATITNRANLINKVNEKKEMLEKNSLLAH